MTQGSVFVHVLKCEGMISCIIPAHRSPPEKYTPASYIYILPPSATFVFVRGRIITFIIPTSSKTRQRYIYIRTKEVCACVFLNCHEMISRYHPVTIRNSHARTRPGRIFISPPLSVRIVVVRPFKAAALWSQKSGRAAERVGGMGGGSVARFTSSLFAFASLTAGVSNVIIR